MHSFFSSFWGALPGTVWPAWAASFQCHALAAAEETYHYDPLANGVDWISFIAYGFLGLLILGFLLTAYRDLRSLFPIAGVGSGMARAWAVARTVIAEAWSARLWALLILWAIICGIVLSVVRPYDESERLPQYLQVLLDSQSFLLMVMLAILACISLPRERERRTIITTGSKPVSRLELLLGKILGFSTAALFLMLVMAVSSYAYFWITDISIRHQAQILYNNQKDDPLSPVDPSLERLADEGSLHAYRYITAAGGMQIAGRVEFTPTGVIRELKGGSSESALFTFNNTVENPPNLNYGKGIALDASGNTLPSFFCEFVILGAPGVEELPKGIQMNVTTSLVRNPRISEDRIITLHLHQKGRNQETGVPFGEYYYQWRPDNDAFWAVPPGAGNLPGGVEAVDPGPIQIKMSCPTKGIYISISDTKDPNQANVRAFDVSKDEAGPSGNLAADYPVATTGFEAHDEEQIVGPDAKIPHDVPEMAVWDFPNLKPGEVKVDNDGNFTVDMVLGIDKQANQNFPTYAHVVAYSKTYRDQREERDVFVSEKRITEVKFPAALLTGDDFYVAVQSNVPGHWLSAKPDRVTIYQGSGSFLFNLVKSEVVIYLEVVLLIVIGVVASIRLGWPVAMLTTAVCYLLGNVSTFVHSLLDVIFFDMFKITEVQHYREYFWFRVLSGLAALLIKFVYFLVNLMPNFTRFDPTSFILHSRDMPMLELFGDIGLAIIYILPAVALGYLLIRKQELA